MQTWLLSPPPTSRLPVRSQHAGPPCLARSDQAAKRSTLLKWPRVWRKARQCCSRSAHLLTSFIASGLLNHWASWSHLALYSFLDSVVEAQGTSSSRLRPEGPFLTPYYPTEASLLLSSSPPETSLRDILSPLGREILGQRGWGRLHDGVHCSALSGQIFCLDLFFPLCVPNTHPDSETKARCLKTRRHLHGEAVGVSALTSRSLGLFLLQCSYKSRSAICQENTGDVRSRFTPVHTQARHNGSQLRP